MNDQLAVEILSWVRIMGAAALRELLEVHIESESDWLIYEATDGKTNRDDVGTQAGVTGRTVGNRWSTWKDAGIVLEHPGVRYPQKIAPGSSVGFEKPNPT